MPYTGTKPRDHRGQQAGDLRGFDGKHFQNTIHGSQKQLQECRKKKRNSPEPVHLVARRQCHPTFYQVEDTSQRHAILANQQAMQPLHKRKTIYYVQTWYRHFECQE